MKPQRDLDPILQAHPAQRDSLIPLLQQVQQRFGYLPREAMVRIGEHLGLPVSKIYGVATFYNQFRFKPPGRYHIQVCRGTACHVRGSSDVLDALKAVLAIEPGDTTRDGLFSLEVVACIGACGLAPVITVDGVFFAAVTPDKVRSIIRDHRRKAREDNPATKETPADDPPS